MALQGALVLALVLLVLLAEASADSILGNSCDSSGSTSLAISRACLL